MLKSGVRRRRRRRGRGGAAEDLIDRLLHDVSCPRCSNGSSTVVEESSFPPPQCFLCLLHQLLPSPHLPSLEDWIDVVAVLMIACILPGFDPVHDWTACWKIFVMQTHSLQSFLRRAPLAQLETKMILYGRHAAPQLPAIHQTFHIVFVPWIKQHITSIQSLRHRKSALFTP